MKSYTSLARFYDSLTTDVPYKEIADFYERIFKLYDLKTRSVLDLACGTGTLTCLLAQRGYDTIGTDSSEEMLSMAFEKAVAYDQAGGLDPRPLFLCQPMEELDLYGTVDAAVCSLDGINYVKPELLNRVFHRVRLFLEPGGVFIFDVNTPEKLKSLNEQVFLDETDDVFCVWRAEFDCEINACIYGMDIFERNNMHWTRSREEHTEYAYETDVLATMLRDEGFVDIRTYGDLTMNAPAVNEQRVFIAARKPQQTPLL
jgi:SAM-dependent methyltransferase